MLKKYARTILIGLVGLIVVSVLAYQIPAVQSRLAWRFEVWSTYFQNAVDPVGKMPTPLPSTPFATFTPESPTPTTLATQPSTSTPTPLPLLLRLPYRRLNTNCRG